MEYKNPFIKVEWEDTPENFTQERLKRVKEYFKQKYNTNHVKLIPKTISNSNNTKLKSLDTSDNILDYQYQKKLIKDFIKENGIEIKWDLIDRLDNRVNEKIISLNQNKVRFNKWSLNRIEFSNFMSFGDDNFIDFDQFNGITVIESAPRNFAGKSTISVFLIMFLLFNKTPQTKTIKDHFNIYRDNNEVKVKGYLTIDGDEYIIERILTRKMSKSGEFTVKSDLDFYKKEINGDINKLSGDQRSKTETFITSAIGTEEDFLTTILTTGRNLDDLIEAKSTERGQILNKFLGLETLKDKEDVCKNMYSEWSKSLISNTYNIVQLEKDIETFEMGILESEKEKTTLNDNLTNYITNLKIQEERKETLLTLKNNDIDESISKINPDSLKKEMEVIKEKQTQSKTQSDLIILVEPSKYYVEDDHEKLKEKINNAFADVKVIENKIKQKEDLLKQLQTGNICPTCNRPLADVDHTSEINKIKDEIDADAELLTTHRSAYVKLVNKSEAFTELKKEYDLYERNKLRKTKYDLEVEQRQLEIDINKSKLDLYISNSKKLEENQKIDAELIGLRSKIETITADIRITNNSIERIKNNILSLTDKITVNQSLIKKIRQEEEIISTFKIYLSIYGKNGISKVIMKNMIPLLNQELQRILSDSCYFTLEMNINDKNELEFITIDNETRIVKPAVSSSGYERTIMSLAIRCVLTKISSLPKPNIVVMDEVFGKVADENLEMVGEFFKKIKNYFEHIFVISHNPLIRNWSDNIVMIKKEENISSIDFITKKI